MKLITTLNEIKRYGPCEPSWNKMVKHVGDLDKPIHLRDIIESNGIEDAIWCMRVWPEYSREWRLFAVGSARQVEHLMPDERSKNAINVAEKFANGEATTEELDEARAASWGAILDSDWDAVGAAAMASACRDDCDAARYAAIDAVAAAAYDAAADRDADWDNVS